MIIKPNVIKMETKDFRAKKLTVTERIATVLIAKNAKANAPKKRNGNCDSSMICNPLKATSKSPLPNKTKAGIIEIMA